jgi:hypothetical protein
MASDTVDQTNDQASVVIEPFRFYRRETDRARLPGGAVMNFAESVHDIAAGVAVLMTILEKDCDLASEAADADPGVEVPARLLTCNEQDVLRRFSRVAMSQLVNEADSLMDWAYEHQTDKGQRETRQRETRQRAVLKANHG